MKCWILICFFIILSACEDRPDIPEFANIDSAEQILEHGPRAYAAQRSSWQEHMDQEDRIRAFRATLGIQGCEGLRIDDPRIVALAADHVISERLARESGGGLGCRCIPMGNQCRANTCFCEEICPNHHGILRARSDQMNPSKRNSFSFENSDEYNKSAYSQYPLDDGFCSGHAVVQKKFQVLSDFRPDLVSTPALTKGSPEWRTYMLAQINNLNEHRPANFLGITGLHELGSDPEFFSALKKRWSFGVDEREAANPEFWQRFIKPTDPIQFRQPNATNIVAHVEKDPDSGADIPATGSSQYHDYIARKVRSIAQGFPATLPGQTDIHSLSKDPEFREIMGSQIAMDWKHFNNLGDDADDGGLTRAGSQSDQEAPMNKTQMTQFLSQAQRHLPEFSRERYPPPPNESWNERGPYQTMTLAFKSHPEVPVAGVEVKHSYHAVEAWAQYTTPSGAKRICIKDPNHEAGNDDRCENYFEVAEPDAENPEIYYSGNSNRLIGKIDFEPYNEGHTALMTQRLVSFCRRVNQSKFRGGACRS